MHCFLKIKEYIKRQINDVIKEIDTFGSFRDFFCFPKLNFQAIMCVLLACQFSHFAASHYVYEAANVVTEESETENNRRSYLFITFKPSKQTKDMSYAN